MIVTRSWLEEFIDLDGITNDKLYETFNSIGLEVDRIEKITIPEGVVIGKILSCEKHPDADKLNVCQIDIGEGVRQIVCGAANVVDAEYVAVATVGTVLGGNFHIKPAELRGVESNGMVCSSTELGLPKINDGIMILDDSIGILDIGRELHDYPLLSDTVIELELTANRGDCLSVHGVARDLSAAFERDIKKTNFLKPKASRVAIARRVNISNNTNEPLELLYKLSHSEQMAVNLLMALRLAHVGIELEGKLSNILQYSTHATGVILRAYDVESLQKKNEVINFSIENNEHGLIELRSGSEKLSMVGVKQSDNYKANENSQDILFEASYISPDSIIGGVSVHKVETDSLYYKTSRGSDPALEFGLKYMINRCVETCECEFSDSYVSVEQEKRENVIAVNFKELNGIIGQTINKSRVSSILSRLGFVINKSSASDSFGVIVPAHRHDMTNIQDIAEEILRMIGINNIKAKHLQLTEKVRLTDSTIKYKAKRDLRSRAVGQGFYEAITYAFSDQVKLEKYGFETVDESKKLLNPIAEEFNTMRSTLLINLLDSVKRNVNYGIKRIPLFEIGIVFDKDRQESEKLALIWSGQLEAEGVSNHGKAKVVDFTSFVHAVGAVIGDFDLMPCKVKNDLMHPYQSADILVDGASIGYVSKLHSKVAEEYGVADTFMAELDLSALLPKHINASDISNYQGVYKDLSIVIDKSIAYTEIDSVVGELDVPLLKKFYPVDVYEDELLGDKKSVTVRCFIQSMQGTLSENDIETTMKEILSALENSCGAQIR